MSVPDYTSKYNTSLPLAKQAAYTAWLGTLPKGQQSTYDYDLPGAFLAGAGRAANGHFPDTFKKPNHPTFSDQSQYSGVDGNTGGQWALGPDKKWIFKASGTNLSYRTPEEMDEYFKTREPDSTLQMITPLPRPRPAQLGDSQ